MQVSGYASMVDPRLGGVAYHPPSAATPSTLPAGDGAQSAASTSSSSSHNAPAQYATGTFATFTFAFA